MIQNKRWQPYLYLAPLLILSGFLLYYAIAFTVYTSFHKWNGLSDTMEFVGLQNYQKMFSDPVVLKSFVNVMIFFIFTTVIQIAFGLMFAVFLRYRFPFRNLFKAVYFIPNILSGVVVAAIFRIILDPNMGNLNVILRSLHLDFLAKPWLGDSKYALASVIAINVFTWAGYNMMIYSSTLLSISDEIYESAIIDGAGFWRILTRITLPMVSGTTRMHVILCLIGALKTFDVVFMLTGGGPAHATEFPGTYLYSKALVEYNAGFGASLGVLILIISMIFSIVQTLITNKE